MNLKFYRADAGYCEFLRKADPCVPYIQDDKNIRPFVGIVLKAVIKARAEKLHRMIVSGQVRPELARRCCNFTVDEEQYRRYCVLHGLDIPAKNA